MEKALASERAAHERTRQQRDRFKWVLQEMIRRYFGRSSEKIDPSQLNLAFAAVEADQALVEAEPPSPSTKPPRRPSQRRARRLEVNQVIKTEVDVTQAQLARNGIEVIYARASFLDPMHVRVENARGQSDLEAPIILIATGTKPAASRAVPINGRNIINSDQILNMPEIPKTFIVVGGGVIGVEYTCMFAILGSRVILVEKRPRLLEFADQEMVEALSYNLRDHRVTMRLNEEVASVEEAPGGGVVANLKSNKRIAGDALLYAVGRHGNVDDLNLATAGLEADER